MARAKSRIEDHHAEWLSLVETSGPFLTIPTLKRTLPDGLDAAPAALADLRIAYVEWQENSDLQTRWVKWVLQELLELNDAVAEATEADPSHRVAEHNVTLRPTFVVRDRSRDASPAVLLVHIVPSGASFTRLATGEAWSASPVDRAVELARASNVPLALVTDGATWTLVWAREAETTGTCTWRANLWLEEQITLRAFTTLLGGHRFFNLPMKEGLAELLQESAGKQQEVADQLGSQVRRAVELLIATLDREDRDLHGELLQDLKGAEVYRGAVTVMMRLVFLFVAEERRLLPINEPRYAETLAASTLRAQLQERADRDSEDPLERSTAAWHRVLALFRAVHSGIEHDALRLPAYGGGLFDPDRYPFLEGRAPESDWHASAAHPLPVDDRTMLHLLDALQTLEQGGARVLLSYQALDVEQIGHVYEGLLDHTAIRLSDTALALGGKHEPEIALGDLDGWAVEGKDTLVARLAKETGKSASAIRKALERPLADEARSRLRAACGNEDALLERVAPYHALLREDLRGDPLVFLAGALFVTQALDRRASGTYYTPRALAEEVVKHTLDPIVFDPGPAQERDPAKWKLKSADALLELNVVDIAMGSGAFLVGSCRYLAARIQDAWAAAGGPIAAHVADGADACGYPLPSDPIERETLALRLVAERCLYGVDKNPMAVEMAKLSLWLLTLAKDRPFSFVDHALRTGDSLLGVNQLQQLRVAHLDPDWPRQASLDLGFDEIQKAVDKARTSRAALEAFVVHDIPDAERKAKLLDEADAALDDARLLGDLVVGAALVQQDDGDPLASTAVAANVQVMLDDGAVAIERDISRSQLRALADDWLDSRRGAIAEVAEITLGDRKPFHWALEFAEVNANGGFDAIVSNPPFQGNKYWRTSLGADFQRFAEAHFGRGRALGKPDLVVLFVLRMAQLIGRAGVAGTLATQSITEVDSRRLLEAGLAEGVGIVRAESARKWPGTTAQVVVSLLWLSRTTHVAAVLDGVAVDGIGASLRPETSSTEIYPLVSSYFAFEGIHNGRGDALVLTPNNSLLPELSGSKFIRHYVSGNDLTSASPETPTRWVIDLTGVKESDLQRLPPTLRDYLFDYVHPTRTADTLKSYKGLHKRWWTFWNTREALFSRTRLNPECIAMAAVSKYVVPFRLPSAWAYTNKVIVFDKPESGIQSLLLSTMFDVWLDAFGGTMGDDRRVMKLAAVMNTFPAPERPIDPGLGREWQHRVVAFTQSGATVTDYLNDVHNVAQASDDVAALRDLLTRLDNMVCEAYGWSDLDLSHGFHETRVGVRFASSPRARREVLTRLTEVNRERYGADASRGLQGKAKGRARRKPIAEGAMTFGFDNA